MNRKQNLLCSGGWGKPISRPSLTKNQTLPLKKRIPIKVTKPEPAIPQIPEVDTEEMKQKELLTHLNNISEALKKGQSEITAEEKTIDIKQSNKSICF